MRRLAAVFAAFIDMLLCVLALTMNVPAKAKTDGIKPKAEYLVQITWPVEMDTDVDLWVVGPSRKPVFYGSRQAGCADLDRDSLGNSTSHIYLADGREVQDKANTETVTIRCFEPGRTDAGINLFSYHGPVEKTPVHIEVTALNPSVRTLWVGDEVLERTGQTINVVSWDMNSEGDITLVSPPLESILTAYEKQKTVAPP